MRDNYQPLKIGRSFLIRPPEQASAATGRHQTIYLERGAFGSGEHETTCSCLELLESLSTTGSRKILDFGSGTGILSIAALLLQPGHAWCLDIDPQAVTRARSNCSLNHLESSVTHLCGTLPQLQERDFNLVLANIYGDILLEMAEALVDKTAPGGYLLLSGVLWEDNFAIKQRYRNLGCRLLKNRLLDDFSTLLFVRQEGFATQTPNAEL